MEGTALINARGSLVRAQKETQNAFMNYTTCLETERHARQEVSLAEKRRDDISKTTASLILVSLIHSCVSGYSAFPNKTIYR